MEIIKNTILGLFFGTFGTIIGGIIGLRFKNIKKVLSFILSFASGLMMAVVCFDLIPESLEMAEFGTVITGIMLGIVTMIICDIIAQNKLKTRKK